MEDNKKPENVSLTIKPDRVKKDSDFMGPVIVIARDKSEILTHTCFCLVKGKVGSGKSRLLMNMMVGLLGGGDKIGLQYTPDFTRPVLYVSTEMSKHELQKRLLKVLDQLPQDFNEDLLQFWDFGLSIGNKLTFFEELVKDLKPHVVIVDQLADFLSDINNAVQSECLVEYFMHMANTYNFSLIGVLHQNEDSGSTSKARGHLGSNLEIKSVSSLAMIKQKKGYLLKTTKLRAGEDFVIPLSFDESTLMFKSNTTVVENELNGLQLPCTTSQLVDHLKTVSGKGDSYVREKILPLVVDRYKLQTEKVKQTIYYKLPD